NSSPRLVAGVMVPPLRVNPERAVGELLAGPPARDAGAVLEIRPARLALKRRDDLRVAVAPCAMIADFRHDERDVAGQAVDRSPRHDHTYGARVHFALE